MALVKIIRDHGYFFLQADDRNGHRGVLQLLSELSIPRRVRKPIPKQAVFKENFGKLWQFKSCVDSWTLGVSRFKKYVYLLHRETPTGPFLPLNIDEKVTLLENFHQEYVVVMLQAVDSSGEDTNHLHSVVVKIGGNGADFDIDGLLQILDGTSMEVLRPELEAKYAPWTYMS